MTKRDYLAFAGLVLIGIVGMVILFVSVAVICRNFIGGY